MTDCTQRAKNDCHIHSWKQFSRKIRSKGNPLLSRLNQYPNSILVTGCQRSGTTMLSRIITRSEGVVNYWFGEDDELDSALILCGYIEEIRRGRFCFQTTYLNECYHEYFDTNDSQKIIWLLRSPYSVICSMVYNWKNFALNELFAGCGIPYLTDYEKRRYARFGNWSIAPIRKACMSYLGKTNQIFELVDRLGEARVLVVDYDELVADKDTHLPLIYNFIDLEYKESYGKYIHKKSANKAKRLSERQRDMIEETCMPIYERAKLLRADPPVL